MSVSGDPVSIAEAAYDGIDAPDAAWLTALADAAATVDTRVGTSAALFDTSRDVLFRELAFARTMPPEVVRATLQSIRDVPQHIQRSMCEFGASFALDAFPELTRLPGGIAMTRIGFPDAFGVKGVDASGRGVMLSCLIPNRRPDVFTPLAPWRRLAAHLTTAFRLRARRAARRAEPDAVLRPDGTVLHATGDARAAAHRAELTGAAKRVDRARTRAERTDARRALALWTALVSGRWSLVDTVERDGKRLLVAHRNDPAGLATPALTQRESQVAALVAGGRSNKDIAYELGIGLSTVETLVLRARRKLGAPTRAALAAWVAAR